MIGGVPREHGEKIAEYTSYEGAQKAVSQLIAGDVPAKDIAIVGRGLRSVETVTGRLGYAAAARSGAVNGILLGLIFSALFVLGTPNAGLQIFVGVMLVGIAMGMLLSLVTFALLRRRRDYTSVTQVIADHYDVTVMPGSISRAREIVGRPVARVAPAAPAPGAAPAPQYGERAEAPQYGERVAPPQYGERVDAPQYGERVDPPQYGERLPAPEASGDADTTGAAPHAPDAEGEPAPGPRDPQSPPQDDPRA
jgi:hypothetical protein